MSAAVTAHDGIDLASVRSAHGTDGPLVLFVHATGFCKEVMAPVVEELADRASDFVAVVPDQRAHGDSGQGTPPFDWWDLGRDVLCHVGDATDVVGVGHSSGAAAVLMAELLQPGTFSSLVLVEPITFPPPYVRFDENPLSVLARKRTASFVSREAARTSWRDKELFARWDDRTFDAFVRGALESSGAGFELKCRPDDEAEFYATATLHGAYDRLGEIDVPVVLVSGADSDSHPIELMEHLTARFSQARLVIVPESGHLVVMERPGAIAGIVADLI